MKNTRLPGASCALVALLLTSCLSRNPPLPMRYFEPAAVESNAGAPWTRSPLQAIEVHAAAHLGDRMTWRVSAVELAFDDTNRWVAKPAALIHDALHAAAKRRGGLAPLRTVMGDDLRVTVEAFEGRLEAPRAARIELRAVYERGDSREPALRTFEARAELSGKGPEALARGMGVALEQVSREVLDWVAEL